MNTIKEAYKKVMKKKPEGFLCSVFAMCSPDEINNINWQFDFYNEKKETISSYVVKGEKIEEANIGEKPFKQDKDKINKLNLENVKINYKEALEIAEKESKEPNSKIIILLQNMDTEIWNISFFTIAFNLVNVKIDAKTKKIISKTCAPLIQF